MKRGSRTHKKKTRVSEEQVHQWLQRTDVGRLASRSTFRRVVFPNLKPTKWDTLYEDFQKSRPISIRLPIRTIATLKRVSLQKGIGYQSLIRLWVTEKLDKWAG